MQWVTWETVGIDRMASAWLIVRHIDPDAEFAFLPKQAAPPAPAGAELFDIPGVRLSHRRGHCTFHTILREYGIQDPILERLARLVDEADTIQEVSLEAAAVGLDWVCRGLRKICRDDAEALRKGYSIFDGLYAYLGDEKGL
ncbi:Chromate resistance exported protein [Acididesulfobacillus acetoxydans]|uniref:Chromate resistance exported protein n=1 Tax=Acididesulfobacillus acetoxydans TaxID=1561005 RepID=A0A8S0XDD4_9FIRM|nr:chromate resistance protein ChrB domain-containing protein [Acididesulfobacillus acetoxydans]CAA7603406.1 Chromate resistance exported protein [Acididesulfobacillus acetoxydans]CEJ06497.1 Chromate resistance exported protein [Acididesulfobacillus acetoxydans]